MKCLASTWFVFGTFGCISLATVAMACGGEVEDGDGGKGGNGTPGSTTQQGGSTTKSGSSSNNVASSTDANVGSTTDASSTASAMCGPGAQTTAQTGGFLQCFMVPQLPCPDQAEAECYLNRDCMPGEEGLTVDGGPNSPTANTNSTAGPSASSGGAGTLCCYSTEGFPCGFMPGSSTGGSGSGIGTSGSGGSGNGGSGSGIGSSGSGGSGSGIGSSGNSGGSGGFGSSGNGGSGNGSGGFGSSGNSGGGV